MVWMGVWQLSPWPCSSTPLSQDSLDSLKRVGWDYQHSQCPLSHQKHNHLPIPKIYSWWASEDTDILGSRMCLSDMSYKIVYVPLKHVTLCHSRRCQLVHQKLLSGLLANYGAMAELCFFPLTSPLAYYFVLPSHPPCPFIFYLVIRPHFELNFSLFFFAVPSLSKIVSLHVTLDQKSGNRQHH